ncbi:MAG: SpaA isopeptide-forming pilin-related protein [Clostridia bacterium]
MSKDLQLIKRLLVAVLILAMALSATVDMLSYADSVTSPQKEILDKVKHELPGQVTAVITADASAPVGQPFNLNIRLDLPRIMTHTYQADLPPSQMFDEYEDVKVTIPLPKGVTAVDKNYLDTSGKNLVVKFPKLYDGDFEGQTNKGKDIKLKLLDNGGVANGEEFIFSGAKWSLDTDVYLDKTENPRREKINITGDISETKHAAKASDAWGLLKTWKKTEEIGNQVVFSFEIAAGLQGAKADGSKFLYSTSTEEYDRYGRLNFQDNTYQITEFIPQLVQINQDGSKIKKEIWPEAVTVIKNAVSAYDIEEKTVYQSNTSNYTQGTTKNITFNQYNTYDPNPKTDIIGESPQYTKYTVCLAYNKDAFLIDANEKVIRTFQVQNEAKLNYQLLGEAAASDADEALASYVIRKGIGQIVLNKYLVYPQDGKEVKRVYDEKAKKEFPMSSALTFTLYTDIACTKVAKTVADKDAIATYSTERGNAVFDYMPAGTYYVKETGAIKDFGAKQNPMQVTVPRSGGTATVEFTNVNKDFGSIAVQKVRKTKDGKEVPFGGVEFELYRNKQDVNDVSKKAPHTIKTESDGNGYLNKIPVGIYYAKELMPNGYKPNEEIYEVEVVADLAKFKGFKASDGKYYGTAENPIVNEANTGMLYFGVIKWDLDLKSEREINYLTPSNQIKPVSTAYAGYKLDLYYEKDGKIVRYKENGKDVTLTADQNGTIKKRLPAGKYYVVANTSGYDKDKYTPWAQNHQMVDGKYCMGAFTVEVYDDNYDLPKPDADGKIDWKKEQGYTTNYDVIHNFSGMCNVSLKKLGSGQYVVPEARFDVYKISGKGAALSTGKRIDKDVKTNNKAYKFFSNVEPGWYAFVETATGPQYYLPKGGIRQDIYVSKAVFDQTMTGKTGIEANKAKMIQKAQLVFFDNKLYDETPLVGLTFKKIDSKTKKQIYDGAKFNVYYIENDVDGSKGLSPIDSQEAKRVYLGVYCYKTNTSTKNKFYETKTYNGITYNIFNAEKGAPKDKTYLVQGKDGKLVPAYGNDTTTMVGWIPYNLLGKDIKLYVEEVTAPLGYNLPSNPSDRIRSTTVKGGTIDETKVLVLENTPKPATCSITVAVSNRNYNQTKDMTAADSRGTYVEGSAVRLYEWNESSKKWVYVAEKNTSIDGTYITESGAVFRTEFGKTYAIAEKKTGNKNNLYYYDVQHKWLKSESKDNLTLGDGIAAGTYKLEEQKTIDGWTLYGPITMPNASEKEVNYKFTFYNLPLQDVWLGKRDAEIDEPILRAGKFSIYRIPEGKSAYDDLSELEWVYNYGSNGGWATYKGARLPVGKYVAVEVRAPYGYSNPGNRKPFSVNETIKLIPGTNQYGVLVTMYNWPIDYYKSRVSNVMNKKVLNPSGGTIKGSLLGEAGDAIDISYQIDGLRLNNVKNGVAYKNAVLEDSGLTYYAGQNGNGDVITLTEDDYAFTSLDIQKATNSSGKFVKATIDYRTTDSNTWQTIGNVELSAQQTSVPLGKEGEKATAFRIKYDDSSVKNGFTGGEVIVNAKLYKRDILKTEEEIISIKNSSNYTFKYGIYSEEGKLTYYDSKQIKDAIINLNPTDLYPQAKIQKSAELLTASGTSENIAKAGDQIRYTITLNNVSNGEQNPMRNPIILDRLPEEVKAVSQGQYEKYFDVTMPSGIKLAAGSGMKTISEETVAALFFDGTLQKGQTITISFLTKVKADAVSVDRLIVNEAAASSAQKGYAISGNVGAASFKDSNGAWPNTNEDYKTIVEKLKKNAYGYITAKADNTIERSEGLTIRKYVQGELDKENGYQSYLSNTTPGGMVNFKVILQNTGNTSVSNIRLADLLPQPGDNVIISENRESKWQSIPQSYNVFKVSKNGQKTQLRPTIYTDTGVFNQSLRGDSAAFDSEWTQGGSFSKNTTAIGFNFGNVTLQEGEYISLELKMKAPTSRDYAGTFASNNASVYYNSASETNKLVVSNTVHTIYHVKPVGMGGKVFLDEDIDGLYAEKEKLISGIPVRLYVYEDGKFKGTLLTTTDKDGRYFFDNLLPSYVKNGKFEGHYYQYQAEFVIPKGTCLTDAYAGSADAWKANELGKVGTTPAPQTNNDSKYSAQKREIDSNADVTTHKTELFYLNPAPNIDEAQPRTRLAGYDLTYDAGLVRVRNIEIKKYSGTTLTTSLKGAEFCLTGTGLPASGITVASDENGIAAFNNPLLGAEGKYYRINYYGNYKIREVKAPEGYVNQNWQTTINAGEDKTNLTYEALNESSQLNYAVNNPKLTSLTIQKQVVNGSSDDLKKDFYFTVIIEGKIYEGAYKLIAADGTSTDKNTDANGRIVLKHGQKAVIEGLEDGQLYIVREGKSDGFTSHITKGMGTIAADANQNIVTCTNTKESGYVRISKVYQGTSIHREASFKFNVKVDGKPYTGYYTINSTSSYTNDGVIRIKGGETAVIEAGIGQKFEIEEISYSNYTTTVTASEGIDLSNLKASGIIKETISEVTYTNTLQTEGLVVTKELIGSDDVYEHYKNSNFIFKMEVDGNPYIGEYIFYPIKGDAIKKESRYTSDGTFTMSAVNAVAFDKLPKGSRYRVSELQDQGGISYIATKLSFDGIIGTGADEVTFENKFKETGKLNIKKVVTQKSDDTTEFRFRLKLNKEFVKELTYKRKKTDGTYTTVKVTDGWILLKHNETAEIEGVPKGTPYEVTEETKDGYLTIIPDNAIGTVDSTTMTVEFINAYQTQGGEAAFSLRKKVNSNKIADHNKSYSFFVWIFHSKMNPTAFTAPWNGTIVDLRTNEERDCRLSARTINISYKIDSTTYSGVAAIVELKEWEELRIPGNEIIARGPAKSSYQVCFTESKKSFSNLRENDIKITRKGTSRCDVDEASFTYTHGDTYVTNAKQVFGYIIYRKVSNALVGVSSNVVTNNYDVTDKTYQIQIEKKWGTASILAAELSKRYPIKIEVNVDGSYVPYSGNITVLKDGKSSTVAVSNGLTTIGLKETLTVTETGYNKFRVTELDSEGLYKTEYSGYDNNNTRIITGNETTSSTIKKAVITNSYNSLYALNIYKTNVGGNANDEFTFKVYLNENPYSGSYKIVSPSDSLKPEDWKNAQTTDGIIKLKGNQRAKIEGILPNTTYYVEEVENSNYVSNCTTNNASGTLNQNISIRFQNTIKNTGLSISKTVVGAEAKDAEDVFEFFVSLKMTGDTAYVPYAGAYSIQQNGKTGDSIQISDGKVRIKAGQLAVLKDIPLGSEYKVEEITHDKYSLTEKKGTEGKITDLGNLATFVNTRKTAGLTIKKVQNGGDANDIFRFKVTLNEAEYTGSYTVKDAAGETLATNTTEDGWLSIKGGQQAEITGIAIGTVYKITEEDRADYEEQIQNAAGIIEEGENKNIETFVNDKIEKALIFSKSNIGGQQEDAFEFELKVDGKAYSGEYTLTDADGKKQTLTAEGGLITLKGGQQASVKLPVGSRYTLEEKDKAGYTKQIPTTSTYVEGGEEPEITVGEGTAEGTMFDGLQRIDFSNLYMEKGLLEINKIREGGSPSDLFVFKVTINDDPYSGDYQIYTEDGMLIPGEHQAKDGTITMTGGGRILISGLNPGDTYTVSETPHPDYECDKPMQSGTISRSGTPEEGSYSVNRADFVNVHKSGGFSVYKNNLGGNISDIFTFTALHEVTETDEAGTSRIFEPFSGMPYKLYQETLGGWEPVLNDEEIFFTTDAEGRFSLTGGQKAVFEDVDSNTKIRITEAEAEGYAASVRLNEGSEIDASEIVFIVTGDTNHEVVYINRIVEQNIEMPETGGMGVAGFAAISALLSAFAIVLLRRKKNSNESL